MFLQLDKTIDIDERRLIRSAIRELRRCEIEEMEAALTSKRFRRAHQNRHEDKENQCRYEELHFFFLFLNDTALSDMQNLQMQKSVVKNTMESLA